MRIAVFPGSFDPLTNGHLDIIRQASPLFDSLVVAVAHNSGKTPLFSMEERTSLIRESVRAFPNVTVDSFAGLLVDYAKSLGAVAAIRGLRDAGDVDFELRMAQMNRSLYDQCVTLLVPTNAKFAMVSSSLVKEVFSYGGDVSKFVPPPVFESLLKRKR